MAGHGERMTRAQEQAIAALLTEPTVEAAALKAGIGYRTLKGWLQVPAFKEAYRQARTEVLERVVAQTLAACGEAVGTLRANLGCDTPAARNTAAKTILETATRGVELLDLEARLAALEEQRKGKP